jgi:hypothetical protein
MTQESIVYKRLTLMTEINTTLGWKSGRRFTKLTSLETGRNSHIYITQRDFKLTLVKRFKEGLFILIRGIINFYAPNVNTPNFIKHTLKDLKPPIDPNTVIPGDFNTPLSLIDMSFRLKHQQRNLETKWHHKSKNTTDAYRIFPLQ